MDWRWDLISCLDSATVTWNRLLDGDGDGDGDLRVYRRAMRHCYRRSGALCGAALGIIVFPFP
jgi:hypothetical protein